MFLCCYHHDIGMAIRVTWDLPHSLIKCHPLLHWLSSGVSTTWEKLTNKSMGEGHFIGDSGEDESDDPDA